MGLIEEVIEEVPVVLETLPKRVEALAHHPLRNEAVVAALLLAVTYYVYRYLTMETEPIMGEYFKSPPRKGNQLYQYSLVKTLSENYTKLKGSFWTVDQPVGATVLVPSRYFAELRNHPNLSFTAITYEKFHSKYSLLGSEAVGGKNEAVVDSIKHQLTRNLGAVMAEIHDETVFAFNREFGPCEDWTEVDINEAMTNIVALISGRVFAGVPLNRDPEYLRPIITFTMECFQAAAALDNWPKWSHPIAQYFIKECKTARASLYGLKKVMDPIFAERLASLARGDAPSNLATWVLENGGEKSNNNSLIQAHYQLSASMAAIHTTSMTTTHVVFDLAARPEYHEMMREELDAVLSEESTPYVTKNSMPKLKKMDSFMKESQRLSPLNLLSFSRKVMKPITLHDGTVLPKGALLGIPSYQRNLDPELYDKPEEFDGLRFYHKREAPGQSTRHQFIETGGSDDQMMQFGLGQHACPGRFFANNEIKVIVEYLLRNYDFKMANGEGRPKNHFVAAGLRPDTSKKVMIKKRNPPPIATVQN